MQKATEGRSAKAAINDSSALLEKRIARYNERLRGLSRISDPKLRRLEQVKLDAEACQIDEQRAIIGRIKRRAIAHEK